MKSPRKLLEHPFICVLRNVRGNLNLKSDVPQGAHSLLFESKNYGLDPKRFSLFLVGIGDEAKDRGGERTRRKRGYSRSRIRRAQLVREPIALKET